MRISILRVHRHDEAAPATKIRRPPASQLQLANNPPQLHRDAIQDRAVHFALESGLLAGGAPACTDPGVSG